MTLGLLKESHDPRVALTPANLAKLAAPGLTLLVEAGAGEAAFFSDDEYAQHARIAPRSEVLQSADMLVSVFPPEEAERKKLKPGTVLVSQFQPFVNPEIAESLQSQGLTAFSLDMIPRTTLAQAMDVLSSMASIAGYQAVLIGAACSSAATYP